MKKIIISSLLIAFVACNHYSKTDENISAGTEKKGTAVKTEAGYWSYIEKYQWNLIQINGKTVDKSGANIRFDAKNSRISGSNGCNRYFGTYSASGNKLSLNAAGSTKMACPPEESALEQDFTEILQQRDFTFDVADQTLNIYRDGKIILMFGRADK